MFAEQISHLFKEASLKRSEFKLELFNTYFAIPRSKLIKADMHLIPPVYLYFEKDLLKF